MSQFDPQNRETPYEPRESGSDGKAYVSGPGTGTGYDSGTLFPEMRLSSLADAEAAAKIANEAYRQGIAHQQGVMLRALGLPDDIHWRLRR
jgi:hypothetical protein